MNVSWIQPQRYRGLISDLAVSRGPHKSSPVSAHFPIQTNENKILTELVYWQETMWIQSAFQTAFRATNVEV